MSNNVILGGVDPDARLDTGMKAIEAINRSRIWWNKTGRHQMKRQQSGAAEKVSLDPESPNYIPSGIINGETWDKLTKREKLTITKHWHHFNIRMSDLIGTPEHVFSFSEKGSIK